MKLKRYLIAVLFVSFYSYSFGQYEFKFKQLTVEQGLPGESVQCVFQDSKGLMWMGIESVGLCKFDGRNYTIYERSEDNPNSISNNFPLTIAEDSAGFLWVGTVEGLNKYDRKTGKFTRFFSSGNSDKGLEYSDVSDVLVDRYNNIWVATRQGVSKYIEKEKKFYNLLMGKDSISEDVPLEITSFYEDIKGNIWITSFSHGLFLVDHATNLNHTRNPNHKLKTTKHLLPIDYQEKHNRDVAIQYVCGYDENSLLIGKRKGLYRFYIDSEIFKKIDITVHPSLENEYISELLKDKQGNIWVGFTAKGLLLINPGENKQFYFDARKNSPSSIRSNIIRGLFEDKNGLIWIASKFQGIYTYDKKQAIFNQHPYNSILNRIIKNEFILSIFEDSGNIIWIGTKHNGIYRFNPEKSSIDKINVSNTRSFPSNRIDCLTGDSFGNIWVGTLNGVVRLNSQGEVKKVYDRYFIKSLFLDKNGNMWVGTNSSGTFFINTLTDKFERFECATQKNFFSRNDLSITKLYISSDSLLWIASNQDGLYKYNLQKGQLSHYLHHSDDSTSISGNLIRCIFEDNNGLLWVGTKSNGLNTYNKKSGKFNRIKKTNDLPPNTIYNIIQDKSNKYWMGSHEGLYELDKNTWEQNVFMKNYGLKGNVFVANAYCYTHDKLMIFGGSNGLNVFDPTQIVKNKTIAPLIVSSIKVYDNLIAEDINEYTEITINYTDKYISFGFALTDYSDPNKIKYRYKLENFDKDWVDIGNRNYATYTGLPPGEYYFKVMAGNADNLWTKEPLTLKLIVTSPLWRKPWFIAMAIVFIFFATFFIYILRLRFIKKNELKLKRVVEEKTLDLMDLNAELEEHKVNLEGIVIERTHELEEARKRADEGNELKSNFLANMSHEIRTPLNTIIGLSDILVSEIDPTDENYNLGEMVQASARTLQQLINDIIDISKIEANQIKILNESFYLNECVYNVVKTYKKQAEIYKQVMDIKFVLDIPDDEIHLISDKIRIEQIFKNLINNSLKFTYKGLIKIGYNVINEESGIENIRFFVKDTGIGIEKENLDKVFERFKKSETKENILQGGTGLGLAISYNLSKLLGGRIWVESEKDKGSQFYFEIPFNQDSERKVVIQEETGRVTNFKWEGKYVLVAEDRDDNFAVVEGILRKTKINIVRVLNGIAAVNKILKDPQKYDVILMDIKMPEMNGIEATKRIKEINASVPVIAQTAFAMEHEEKEILISGFNNYLAKPFHKGALLSIMAKYLTK